MRTLQTQLIRPRVQSLLEGGAEHNLTLLTAAPGFGKSTALRHFALEHRLTATLQVAANDPDGEHFWRALSDCLCTLFPASAADWQALSFPEITKSLDPLLEALSRAPGTDGRACILVDDYHDLRHEGARGLIEGLLAAGPTSVGFMIADSGQSDVGTACIRGGGSVFELTGPQLAFTPAEIGELASRMGRTLQRCDAAVLHDRTGGWPLAVSLCLQQSPSGEKFCSSDPALLYQLLEGDYFSPYRRDTRTLLCQLALLEPFSPALARGLADSGENVLEILHRNPFVSYDLGENRFTLQPVYRRFLLFKGTSLEDDAAFRAFARAAALSLREGDAYHAVLYYGRCGQHAEMLEAMGQLPLVRMGSEPSGAMLEQLEALPEDVYDSPLVGYFRAALLLNRLQVDQAWELLKDLESRLQLQDEAEARWLLGEVCTVLGSVCLMRHDEQFGAYYHKARQLLRSGSRFVREGRMILGHASVLFLTDTAPGNLQRMEALYHAAAGDMQQVLGAGQGMEHLFSAEGAYNTFDFKEAKRHTHRALLLAREHGQHDIACNAYFLLARVGAMFGHYGEFRQNLQEVRRYVENHPSPRLAEIRDCVEGWFFATIGEWDRVPEWIADSLVPDADRPLIDYERSLLIHGLILMIREQYAELAALLEHLEPMCRAQGLWLDLLMVLIQRAIADYRLGKVDTAMDCFAQAYDMTYHNGIITPFVEVGSHTRTLIDAVLARGDGRFDEGWCADVRTKASSHAKRMAHIRRQYLASRKKAPEPGAGLTPREMDILRSLAQGMTQQEIAAFYQLSVNTVKSHVRNIYGKLGALNKADAIRSAMQQGLLE